MTGTPAQPKARAGRPGPLTGVCVGPFRLCHVLGSGAAGCVYLGAHTERPDFRVAVKVVPKLGPRSPAAAAAISREVAALKALQHEGIVSLLDLRENSRYSYLITEYVDGGDLFRRLSACGDAHGGPTGLPVPFLRRVLRKVTEAMLHAATLGFCHRDVKVENILVSRCGQHVKLADWGFSAIGLQSRGTRCGSPHYVAPEIISQPHYNGFAADVWSLGVTTFVLATGYMAFATEDRHELSRMIMEGRVDWGVARAAGLPNDLMSLLSSMLCVDPGRRIGLREVLDHPFLAADAAAMRDASGLEGFGASWSARRAEAAVIPSSWSAFHEPDDSATHDEDALLSLCDLGLGESNVATVQELVRHPARSRYGGLERTLYALIARHHRMQDENALLQTPAGASCRGERMIVEGTPDRPAASSRVPAAAQQMFKPPGGERAAAHPAPMKLHTNQSELYAKMARLRGVTN